MIIRTEVRDYLIDTADLVLAGQLALPERGDRIEEIEAGKKFTYEVMTLGTEPHWRYSDAYRKTLRVHGGHIRCKPARCNGFGISQRNHTVHRDL